MTKPSYEELRRELDTYKGLLDNSRTLHDATETSLARVRGLLQLATGLLDRSSAFGICGQWRTDCDEALAELESKSMSSATCRCDCHARGEAKPCFYCANSHNFYGAVAPERISGTPADLAECGAESADIGKLDTAESDVRRLLEMAETPCERPRQRFYDFLRERDAWQEGDRNLDYGELILKCIKATLPGSAETGGEKVAPKRKCADCAMDEDNGCHRNFTGEAGYFHPFVPRLKDSPRLGLAAEVETSRSNGGERTAESLAGQVVESVEFCKCQHVRTYHPSGGHCLFYDGMPCPCSEFMLPEHRKHKDSEIAPYPGVIETAAGISLSIKRYNELIEAEQALATFPRNSQNQTVSSGVEGAHEGTTADKSVALAESSLSSPPPDEKLTAMIRRLQSAVRQQLVLRAPIDEHLARAMAKMACDEADALLATVRQSSSLLEPGAESVQPGKQNTADKSELLPTQLPKEK